MRFILLSISLLLASYASAQLDSSKLILVNNDTLDESPTIIPIELKVLNACENLEYELGWRIKLPDSIKPNKLLLIGARFDPEDYRKNLVYFAILDSARLYQEKKIKVNPPGYFILEAEDTIKKVKYISNEVYIEQCSQFQLPERFLFENGSTFKATRNVQISKIDLVIFNQKGDEVFKTKDPNFAWDLRHMQTWDLCPPGNYFYHCDVFEIKDGVSQKRNITGIIEIVY